MNLFLQKIHSNGFHLIEIMVVVAIISILAIVSIPLYTQYTVHARRTEAASALIQLAIAMEQFHLEHDTYQTATLSLLNFPEEIAEHHYRLLISAATQTTYDLHAIPIGKQANNDIACATLRLDSQNRKSMTGTGSLNECW